VFKVIVPLLFVLTTQFHSSVHAVTLPKGVIEQDGRPAPKLQLEDMDGNAIDLEQLRGKWVFVHFWASWCGPCRREMPLLQGLPAQVNDGRFSMLLINTAEDEDTVFTFLAAVAPNLVTYMDRDGLATEAWQPRGLPATYLVDPGGRIRFQALGGRPWNEGDYVGFLKAIVDE
jgi:thiol-disulfide isomerase/thioredoxin